MRNVCTGVCRTLLEAVVETVMLVCAVLLSLAMGVLVSYAMCQVMFRVFRVHSLAAAQRRSVKAPAIAIQA